MGGGGDWWQGSPVLIVRKTDRDYSFCKSLWWEGGGCEGYRAVEICENQRASKGKAGIEDAVVKREMRRTTYPNQWTSRMYIFFVWPHGQNFDVFVNRMVVPHCCYRVFVRKEVDLSPFQFLSCNRKWTRSSLSKVVRTRNHFNQEKISFRYTCVWHNCFGPWKIQAF